MRDLKPKAILSRPLIKKYAQNNHHPQFIRFERMLEEFFDLFIIENPSDYEEIVDNYNPDIIIFQFISYQTNLIKNVKNNDQILKIGLGVLDGSDVKKGVYYRLLDKIGIEYFFFLEVTAGSVFPELKKKIFYIPQFIDPNINKDYKLNKNIPVLITGNHSKDFYKWRSEVKDHLLDNFPTLYYRHPGYKPQKDNFDALRIKGETYYRTINASYISPTCGSFRNTILYKHLEIPGSRACLVCEESEIVKLHGFKDMENCVFATPENIVEKSKYLFENPEELNRITDNGYEFVHNNHTYKNRAQILQLYELLKKKKPRQRIIQPSILGDLELVEEEDSRETIHMKVSDEIEWIKQIDKDIVNKNYVRAENECKRIIEIADYIADAKLRLYIIHMLNGRKSYGYNVLKQLLKYGYKNPVLPDPIDYAFFIVHLLSEGEVEKAVYHSRVQIDKRRPELDYARLLAFNHAGESEYSEALRNAVIESGDRKDLKSIYYFYFREFNILEIFQAVVKRNIKEVKKIGAYQYDSLINKTRKSANVPDGFLEEINIIHDGGKFENDIKKLNSNVLFLDRIVYKIQTLLTSIK